MKADTKPWLLIFRKNDLSADYFDANAPFSALCCGGAGRHIVNQVSMFGADYGKPHTKCIKKVATIVVIYRQPQIRKSWSKQSSLSFMANGGIIKLTKL